MTRLQDYLTRLVPRFLDVKSLPLITDVLSLVDYLLATGEAPIPKFGSDQLQDLRILLEQAVIEAIEESETTNTASLSKLTDWILSAPVAGEEPLSIVSTNYDMVIEKQLFEKLKVKAWRDASDADRDELESVHARALDSVDLGFIWREHRSGCFLPEIHAPPMSPTVRVFKLHGSVNWLKCPLCGFVYVNTTGSINSQAFRGDKVDYNNTCLCGHGPVRSVIVAPSMVRSIQDPNLLTIWRSALERLRTANEWVIVGYSLPPEDIAIRSILLRGYHGRGKYGPPIVTVVQPSENEDIQNRYNLLLPNCTFEFGGFTKYISGLPKPATRFPTI